jgi:NADH:ubiquinone oxidoreductase subunit 3 (subunit A)
LLSIIIFFLSYSLSLKEDDLEKLSIYECGFNPFDDSRSEFNIKFFLVAILFIIFDLEVSFLFPFVASLDFVNFFSAAAMIFFLLLLTIGFLYEWFKGALD